VADSSDLFGMVVVYNDDGTAAVSPSGELDLHTAPRLADRVRTLFAEGRRRVTLDLGALSFIDSAGLGSLVIMHKQAALGGVEFVVTNPQPQVLEVMEISGLLRVIQVEGASES
jgi:anti-anti-sigma factor